MKCSRRISCFAVKSLTRWNLANSRWNHLRDEIRARAGLGLALIIEYFRCFDCAQHDSSIVVILSTLICHSELVEESLAFAMTDKWRAITFAILSFLLAKMIESHKSKKLFYRKRSYRLRSRMTKTTLRVTKTAALWWQADVSTTLNMTVK